jgi:hypothetical protein
MTIFVMGKSKEWQAGVARGLCSLTEEMLQK